MLNIMGLMMPMAMLQFVALPYIGKEMGAESYGEITFMISIFTLIALPFGNVLNNVRLLESERYKKKGIVGDFNFLFVNTLIIASIVFVIVSTQIDFIKINNIFYLLLIILLTIFKEYYVVSFRLELNFTRIMLHNFYLSLGFLLGTFVFKWTGIWESIYIVGLIMGSIYIYRHSKLVKESFKRTKLFKDTLKSYVSLYIASLLKNSLQHADKLLLFPLLGARSVAIYYTSVIIGRILSMFVGPMNSVILSYLVKEKEKKGLKKQMVIAIIIAVPSYFSIIILGPYFLKFFYPDWASESISLLRITAATAVIGVISSLLQPFNLRFNQLKWQLYINGIHLIVYLILVFYLTLKLGLVGFTTGVLLSSIFNLVLQIFIYYYDQKKEI